jgi:beta-carotene/zeaxanthin 4-ketolase
MKVMQTLTLRRTQDGSLGIFWAIAILAIWVISLFMGCAIDLTEMSITWLGLAILARTFSQTGLFVVAHDAMHGSLVPDCRPLNDWVGRIMVNLYACLSYRQICRNHIQHHRHTSQADDPDFHDGVHSHLFLWYWRFLLSYISGRSIILQVASGMSIFIGFHYLFHVSATQFMALWIVPLILSSMQLFFFGTYLPHRQETLPAKKVEKAWMLQVVRFWSLLSCYHFGAYHWEHHRYPKTPWYRLPDVSNQCL